MELDKLCLNCPLCLNVSYQLSGQGSTKPTILFVYSHPSKTQDRNKEIFIGRHYTKFKRVLEHYNLFSCSYHTHLIKCRTSSVDDWEYKRMELTSNVCSSTHFAKEFYKIKPYVKVIVPVGQFAFRLMTNHSYLDYDEYLNKVNVPIELDGFKIYPIESINMLINHHKLDIVIKNLMNYYAIHYNYNLLIL